MINRMFGLEDCFVDAFNEKGNIELTIPKPAIFKNSFREIISVSF